MEEKLITTREASNILGIPEQDVINLANAGKLASIKVGGEYLRYRKKDVYAIKEQVIQKMQAVPRHKVPGSLGEFFYFYDFYAICGGIIVILLWVIIKDIHS